MRKEKYICFLNDFKSNFRRTTHVTDASVNYDGRRKKNTINQNRCVSRTHLRDLRAILDEKPLEQCYWPAWTKFYNSKTRPNIVNEREKKYIGILLRPCREKL